MSVRVLIVDDQAPFRDAARAVTEATDGFEVVGESETREASVEAARELKPDLVLIDVNLPGINGFDASRRILKDSNGVVVVLLLSTYEEEEYAALADAYRCRCGMRVLGHVLQRFENAEIDPRLHLRRITRKRTGDDLDRDWRSASLRRDGGDQPILGKNRWVQPSPQLA